MAITAEWICTRCGSTNRRLVPPGARRAVDRCFSCGARHEIEADVRPVRWKAKPLGKRGTRNAEDATNGREAARSDIRVPR